MTKDNDNSLTSSDIEKAYKKLDQNDKVVIDECSFELESAIKSKYSDKLPKIGEGAMHELLAKIGILLIGGES
jgi:hypothetical protein